MWLNIPNILTLLRIALIPIFVICFYLPVSWADTASALLFTLAAVTDWLDGYLARRLQQTSPFGAFLDPVADKLMVAAALVLLVEHNPTHYAGLYIAIPAIIIIGREIAISALREWMAELGARTKVAVSRIGKAKTALQMVAIILLLYRAPVGSIPVVEVGFWLLYIAAGLTLWSAAVYLKAAWPILSGSSS